MADPACDACGAPVRGRFCGECGAARPASPTRDVDTGSAPALGGTTAADAPPGGMRPAPPRPADPYFAPYVPPPSRGGSADRAPGFGDDRTDAGDGTTRSDPTGGSSGYGSPGYGATDGREHGGGARQDRSPGSGASGFGSSAYGASGYGASAYGGASAGPGGLDPRTGAPFVVGDDPEPRRRRTGPLVAALVAGLLVVAGGVWWASQRGDSPAPPPTTTAPTTTAAPTTPDAPTSSPAPSSTPPASASPTGTPAPTTVTVTATPPTTGAPTPTGTATGPTGTPTPGTPATPEDMAAQARLENRRALDLARFERTPHVVAVLSSKHDGTVDPAQLTDAGSTRWTSRDILTQYRRLHARWDRVLVLRGTDLGSRNRFRDDWVTFFDPGTFATMADAQRWCDANMPGGQNVCNPSRTR